MPILLIEDFTHGLDVRKSPLTAPPGSLQMMQDAVLTNGAEIERRKAFVNVGPLPPGTVGLSAWDGQITVYSMSLPDGPLSVPNCPIPVNCKYVDLSSSIGASNITAIVDYDTWDNYPFIIARGDNGLTQPIWLGPAGQVDIPVKGQYCRTHRSKVYMGDQADLRFSDVGDPGSWTDQDVNDPRGAGFISQAQDDADAEYVTGLEIYYDRMAVLARLVTLIWYLDPDPTQNNLLQTLRIGTISGLSAIQFGTGDVMFLSDSGIRSLRAMNISMAASVIDVGSPIDPIVTNHILTNPVEAYVARAVIEPVFGRYWLAFDNTIYVLSYFPSSKVSAWSTFVLPFHVDYMASTNNQVYVRNGDDLYLYGGADGLTYDNTPAIVRTPMMHNQAPSIWKRISSIDLMIQGSWALDIGMNPGAPFTYERCGVFTGETFSLQKIKFAGYGTHIGLQLTSQDATPGRIASISINYQDGEVKGGGD
jgi:hypothetical protein